MCEFGILWNFENITIYNHTQINSYTQQQLVICVLTPIIYHQITYIEDLSGKETLNHDDNNEGTKTNIKDHWYPVQYVVPGGNS